MKAHFSHLRNCLMLEYQHEKAEYARLSQSVGVERLVARGVCRYPMRLGKSYYNSLNQFVLELVPEEEIDAEELQHETESQFEYGRQVRFFRVLDDGGISYYHLRSTVSYAEPNRIALVLDAPSQVAALDSDVAIGVQLELDETSYQAMFQALNEVESASESRLAELRDVLVGRAKPGFRQMPSVPFPWLNAAQQEAVNRALASRDVMIVHGPPGTGKTTTLVEAIDETLRREPQVMVCAQSNAAVDWICQRLTERGIPVLRIGNPVRVTDEMLASTYERRFADHPRYPELWAARRQMQQLQSTSGKSQSVRNRIHHLRRMCEELEIEISESTFGNARVIASTLVGSNHRLLYGRHYGTLFIDEASQALEPACWIAIRKADRVILAGDHCQLPPTVKCYEAQKAGLERTLMERLATTTPQCVALLRVQYRMNEAIMRFPSQWFYHGMLEAAPSVKYRGILDWDTPMEWIDTSEMEFLERCVETTHGRLNEGEGDFFVNYLADYVERIGVDRIIEEHIDFGIISPYKAQVQYLRRRIKHEPRLRKVRSRLSVNTIDGFQGQERDVVMVSLVRSNEEGSIGFLHDLRRMNVAITRARMKLVLVGAAKTLCKHRFYRLLKQIVDEGDV